MMTLLTLGMTSSMKTMNNKYHIIYDYMEMVKEFHEVKVIGRTPRKICLIFNYYKNHGKL